jgi:hypothetical protein
MNTPQKHAALIKAWADGYEIECQTSFKDWVGTNIPTWDDATEYRIKPEPKIDTLLYVATSPKGFISAATSTFYSANLKLTFCGETGSLKAAEVLT